MTRTEKALRAAYLEQVAAAINLEARSLRNDLEEEALDEYRTNGNAVSWRTPDISVIAAVSKEAVVVSNLPALTAWAILRHPTEVESIPTIRPAWLGGLLSRAVPVGDEAYEPETGEVIPGLGVRAGGVFGGIRIVPTPAAKQALAAVAKAHVQDVLPTLAARAVGATVLAGPAVPTVLAEVDP